MTQHRHALAEQDWHIGYSKNTSKAAQFISVWASMAYKLVDYNGIIGQDGCSLYSICCGHTQLTLENMFSGSGW